MNFLTLGIHYPIKEHTQDILDVATKVAVKARQLDGNVDAGAWIDEDNGRVIMMSLWSSPELAAQASPQLRPIIAAGNWVAWERQPSDNMLTLKRAV